MTPASARDATPAARPRRPRAGFRRRLDTFSLRTQARLDAEWADVALPWILAVGLFALLFAMSLAVVRQLDGGPGLAVWRQAAWHVRTGGSATSSLTGTNPATDQWSFVALPLLWLTRWVPTSQLLGGVQAAALAIAVVPIWNMARRVYDLRIGTTAAVVGAYALAPTLHAANLGMFHPEAIAVPALAGAVYFQRRKAWVPYWVCVGLVLVSRGDLGLTVAALGVLALIDGDRVAALLTIVVGVGWTVAAVVALDPQLPQHQLTAAQAFAASGTAPLAEVRALVSDPGQLLGDLFGQTSLPILVALFAPLLFLPFTVPRSLIPAVPALVLGITSSHAIQAASERGVPESAFGAGRTLVAVVPITMASLFALSRIGRRSITRVNVDHRIVAAIVLASVILFVEGAPSSPYQQPWAWGSRDQQDAARLIAVGKVPPDAAVTVSPQLAPEVARRDRVYDTWVGPPPLDQLSFTTPYVVLDTTAEGPGGAPLWPDDARDRVLAALGKDYRQLYGAEGIYTLRRRT